jgi:metallophosphoesterase superfamily enzyme
MRKFVFLTDLHFGFERASGHKSPLHDMKAIKTALDFVRDFQPDVLVIGGDFLDAGCLSHHNKNKPGRTEGMRILADAKELREKVIMPLELAAPNAKLVWIVGNHEQWLADFQDDFPALEGMLDLKALMKLGDRWEIVPQGGYYNLGKLTFIHGDTVSGGEHVAKSAVISYERSVLMGHHHTYQAYSKVSALDYKNAKVGVSVPCLCGRTPHYGKGRPNRWQQGFAWGYVHADGGFSHFVSLIINGKTVADGKVYGS